MFTGVFVAGVFRSVTVSDTMEYAKSLAQHFMPGGVVCLTGGLGCGKTVFAKGFAQGLGIERDVTSPTFIILNEYADEGARIPLYHFDVYRINSIEEMDDTGFEHYFYQGGVCLVEWAEIVKDIIPEGAVWVNIYKNAGLGENYRKIRITGGNDDSGN